MKLEAGNYAVVFSSIEGANRDGYADMMQSILDIMRDQDGFLGMESGSDGNRHTTVCYWKDLASIQAWKQVALHRDAQTKGREQWYDYYRVTVSRIEYTYDFKRD